MTKDDIKSMVKAEVPADVDDGTLDLWVEAGRLMVASGDGLFSWPSLIVKTTLSVVSGTSDYTIPTTGDAATYGLLDKLLALEPQAETSVPVRIYSVEAAAEIDFTNNAASGIMIIDFPEPGKIKVRIKATPTKTETWDLWYKRQVASDTLDFVSFNNQDVFYWAALVFAYKKVDNQSGGFTNAVQMYKDRLKAAMDNAYTATQEHMRFIKSVAAQQLESDLIGFSGDR